MTDVIAHRGASRGARENTIEAFRLAVALGAEAVELDVRRTADGVLVVHHDAVVGDGRAIVETRRADVPDHVPDLGAALDAAAGVVVNIEIKNDKRDPDFDPGDAVADAVVALLGRRDEPVSRWLVSSFRLATVDRLHAQRPDLPTALLSVDAEPSTIARCREHGHGTWHPWIGALSADAVSAARAEGLLVNTWTVNDPDQARRAAEWGVDGIVTDVPDVIRAALGSATPT